MKHIRGYGIEIDICILYFGICFYMTPLAWRKPLLCVPEKTNRLTNTKHLYIGCFHILNFPMKDLFRFAFTFDYDCCWNHEFDLKHSGYKKIF